MADNIDQYQPMGELFTDSSQFDLRRWQSPGAVSEAYTESTAIVRMLLGPVGGGKTTTCLATEVLEAVRSPRCLDGVRRYRVLAIRDTYRELYKTLIPSWLTLFNQLDGNWSGGQDRPAKHTLKFVDDFGPVEFEIEFAAIPATSIRAWLDGYEPTAVFMNAASGHPEDVYNFSALRIGRFPKQQMLPRGYAAPKHIAMDSNKTDITHWIYELAETARAGERDRTTNRPLVEVFDQPGGRSPHAENVENLTPGYYDTQVSVLAKKPWLLRIMVDNQWGPDRSGQPVFENYSDDLHLAREDLTASRDVELCVGLDAGTHMGGRPSAVFFQVLPGPCVDIIDEVYLGRAGPKRFSDAMLEKFDKPHLRDAVASLRGWGDPSAFYGADEEGGEITWIQMMETALGISIGCPESNELHAFRIPTIEHVLTQLITPTRAMLRISPRCKVLRAGFNSGYRYPKKEVKGVVKEDRDPEKNEWSHVQDALQHGLTGYFGKSLILNSPRTLRTNPNAERVLSHSPFSLNFPLK